MRQFFFPYKEYPSLFPFPTPTTIHPLPQITYKSIFIYYKAKQPRKSIDAILPRKGPVTRAMSKRLQEDWARAAEEGPRVLMNLRVDF